MFKLQVGFLNFLSKAKFFFKKNYNWLLFEQSNIIKKLKILTMCELL
jgi:hypothetical protein